MRRLWTILFFSLASFGCTHPIAPSPPAATAPVAPTPIASSAPAETGPCDLPDITLRANSVVILPGNSTTLTWNSLRAGTVNIRPDIGPVSASGERVVSPAGSTTYTATATGPCGTSVDILRVTVTEAAPNLVTTFNAGVIVDRIAPPPPPPLPPLLPIDFDFDSAEIRKDQDAKLQATALYLRTNASKRLNIEGHADKRGSEEYNLALGDRRANAIKEYLRSFAIAADRIHTVSYGEERPICIGEFESCYAQNRRALLRTDP